MERENWKPFRLDQLGFIGRGRSRNRPRNDPALYGGPYPLFETGDIKSATLYLSNPKKTYNEKGLSQSKLWNPDTLCITIAANIAETAILNSKACFPDSVVGFVANPEKTDARYIKYYIDFIKLQMQNISHGTTQDNLSLGKLLTFDFLMPPLNIQRKIFDILSAYDEFIEINQQRTALLERAGQEIYREWFARLRFPGYEGTKIVDGVPVGWESKIYSDVFKFLGGFAFKSKTYNPEGRFGIVTIKNVHNAQFIPECSSRLDDVPEKMKEHCALATGDVLLSLTGDVGRCCMVFGESYLLNQRVAKVVSNTDIPKSFVYWTFSNETVRRELENLAHGAAQSNLSPVTLGNRKFIKPASIILELFGKIADPNFLANYNFEPSNSSTQPGSRPSSATLDVR